MEMSHPAARTGAAVASSGSERLTGDGRPDMSRIVRQVAELMSAHSENCCPTLERRSLRKSRASILCRTSVEPVSTLREQRASVDDCFKVREASELCSLQSPSVQRSARKRGLTVRPLQPVLRDAFDTDAQRDQFGQGDLVRVRRLDAAERPLQTIAGGIGLRDQLVGWRRSFLARRAGIRLGTQRRHRSARDLGTAPSRF